MNAFRLTLRRMLDAFAYANTGNPREVLALLARNHASLPPQTGPADTPDLAHSLASGSTKSRSSARMTYGSEPLPR